MNSTEHQEPEPWQLDPHGEPPARPVAPLQPLEPVSQGGHIETVGERGADLIEAVRAWLERFVLTMTPKDLDLLALWAVHTHLATECYTSPRLQLDSPMPGSGKTTVLDHLSRLCHRPVQMASISSSALLARLLANEIRTLLIDEVDRTLDPKREGAGDVIAILNSGYRVGASRPVLEPVKGGGWEAREMTVYAPVAMAGNNPNLPDDTRSRIVRVVLLPDLRGVVEESDWELIEDEAAALRDRISTWAHSVAEQIRKARPELPPGVIGRNREKWGPLARIAEVAGGRWPQVVSELASDHLKEQEMDRADGLAREAPVVLLLKHLAEVWPGGQPFATTQQLLASLAEGYPEQWGVASYSGKAITAQRLGRMISQAYKVHTQRLEHGGPRGYTLASLRPVMNRMGVTPPGGTGSSGSAGETGPEDGRCQCRNRAHGIHGDTCRAAA